MDMGKCRYERMSYMRALVSRPKPEILSNGWRAAGEQGCSGRRGADSAVYDRTIKRDKEWPQKATSPEGLSNLAGTSQEEGLAPLLD